MCEIISLTFISRHCVGTNTHNNRDPGTHIGKDPGIPIGKDRGTLIGGDASILMGVRFLRADLILRLR